MLFVIFSTDILHLKAQCGRSFGAFIAIHMRSFSLPQASWPTSSNSPVSNPDFSEISVHQHEIFLKPMWAITCQRATSQEACGSG
jgi:hypothetical protein